jgi:hypothetical protein
MEGRKRVIGIIAGIIMARNLDVADDLFGGPQGSPRAVVFDFRLGRGRDGPRQFLGQFEGLLQMDMGPTIRSEGRRWFMRGAGRMPNDIFLKS